MPVIILIEMFSLGQRIVMALTLHCLSRGFTAALLLLLCQCAPAARAAVKQPSAAPRVVIVYHGSDSLANTVEGAVQRAKADTALDAQIRRSDSEAGVEALLSELLEAGQQSLILVQPPNVVPLLKLTERYPHVRFTVVDGAVPSSASNVQSLVLDDHEGAFLVGMAAAFSSKTDVVGFIGYADSPVARNLSFGFLQGVKFARPSVRVLTEMAASMAAGEKKAPDTGELARKLFDQQADVVFAAIRTRGQDILEAASVRHKLAIGMDINQNALYPGTVLTCLIRRIDLAVYEALQSFGRGQWQPGTRYLGLKEGYIDYSVDQHNKALLSAQTIDKLEVAKDLMLRGLIEVKPYTGSKGDVK